MSNEIQSATPGEQAIVPNGHYDKLGKRFAKLLHKFAEDEVEKYESGKLFPFPFFVDEAYLKKLHSEAIESIDRLKINESLEFKSVTRFQDLSTIKFDSFEEFLNRAGNKKDPESTKLVWSKFSVDDNGEPLAAIIKVSFITEKKMETIDAAPGDYNHAWAELSVSGSDLLWVEKTFSDFKPYIETSKLSGIYRPLWIFRNKYVINIMSQVFSWLGFFIGINYISKLFTKDSKITKVQVLNKVLAESNILNKFDIYVSQILKPPKSPWWEPIIVIGSSLVCMLLVYTAGMGLFPKLAPSSNIAIGLSNTRAKNRLNTFKFIIFTIIVSGILVPIFVEIIKHLL